MMKQVLLVVASIFMLITLPVVAGDRELSGGDICENRIQNIGADIEDWIYQGGSEGLSFPVGIKLEAYNLAMLQSISTSLVSCVDEKLMVGKSEKTCINYIDEERVKRLQCNTTRFQNNNEEEQYRLVHHEYAGLARIEINQGKEPSNYYISNQLTAFLEDVTIKKLAIKSKKSEPLVCDLYKASAKGITEQHNFTAQAKGYNLIFSLDVSRENGRLLQLKSDKGALGGRMRRRGYSSLGVFEEIAWNDEETVFVSLSKLYYFSQSLPYFDDYSQGEYAEFVKENKSRYSAVISKLLAELPNCQDLQRGTITRNLVRF